MSHRITRRKLLESLSAAPLAFWLLPEGLARGYVANEKLNIALVGIGGRGSWFVDTIPRIGENIVAVCDVNDDRAAESLKKMAKVPRYYDYRKMLVEKDKQIDAVIIAAPDHIHAPCGIMAMKMGKHLYCEKPLTNNIEEARRMRQVAKETGVATQMGNQGTATHALREQVEIVRSGDLGDIQQVLVWNSAGGSGPRPIPRDEMPIPDHLKWDLWLGPRKDRPYHQDWMRWHAWREFGTAQLGNWAIHSTNMQFMALEVDKLWYNEALPVNRRTIRVRAEVSGIDRVRFPKWEIVHYDIPARGSWPAYTVSWHNGLASPGFRETLERPLGRRLITGGPGPWKEHGGCLVVGSKGTIHSTEHNSSYTLLPKEKFADYQKPDPTLPRHGSHEREWVRACRGGPKAMSNFDYGAVLTEFVLMGNVATQFDRPIEYDPVAMKCVGDEEATAALRREHRPGWEIS
ncbi:MAG: Gfo/Idh/MocA family oxidoreductase [Planctomycetes bacterium]|nr:Gfo/Idh/MocA family oxidoreductase [Planctomycetota bacterium]